MKFISYLQRKFLQSEESEENELFLKVFDFRFQTLKEHIELGLEGRISILKQQKTNSETSLRFVCE